MCLRYLTPFIVLSLAGLSPAAEVPPENTQPDSPDGRPGTLFERFDQDHDQQLSRQEFVRGLMALRRHRAERGDHELPGDGEGRAPRPNGEENGGGEGEGRPHRPPGQGGGEGEGRPHRPPGQGDGEGRPEGGPALGLFDRADTDKNGSLSLEEFRAALKNLPRPGGQDAGERPRQPKTAE
jgi:hypothetical protein